MPLNQPIIGRITLTLKADTMKALLLLALLRDESKDDVAESLLTAGGLHTAVDIAWNARNSGRIANPSTISRLTMPEPPKNHDNNPNPMTEIPGENTTEEELPPW